MNFHEAALLLLELGVSERREWTHEQVLLRSVLALIGRGAQLCGSLRASACWRA